MFSRNIKWKKLVQKNLTEIFFFVWKKMSHWRYKSVQKDLGPKKCWSKKMLCPQNFGFKNFSQRSLGPSDFRIKKILVLKKEGGKSCLNQNDIGHDKFGIQKIWVQKNVGSKKCWVPTNFLFQKSLGQSLSKRIKALKILAPKNFVKIRSVTAETFLIWTNVARTNVSWINVTVTIGICKRLYQETTFKVWSKSDQ